MISLAMLPFAGVLTALGKAVIEVATPIAKGLAEASVAFAKSFWKGLGVIWDNKSTLSVIAVVIVLSGYYFRTWDNEKVLKSCKQEIATIEKNVPKKYLPNKVKGHYRQPSAVERTFTFPSHVGN